MSVPISGETFVRTFVRRLDTNEQAPLPSPALSDASAQAPMNGGNGTSMATSLFGKSTSRPPSSAAHSRPASISTQIPYRSLLAVASQSTNAPTTTPPMHLRPFERLDIHYFYFLLVQFEHLGLDIGNPALLGDIPEDGILGTETTATAGKAPSVMSTESFASTFSTLSLNNVRSIFHRPFSRQPASEKPIHEEVVHIYKHFARVSALKLYMQLFVDPHSGATHSGKRPICAFEKPLTQDGSVMLSMSPFRNLSYLELSHVHPRCLDGWPELQRSLVHLVIKGASVEDAADVLLPKQDPTKTANWERLETLSLADNSLTTLDTEPLQRVRTLTHLDLSSNLLIDTPAALSSLFNLQSLNLSYNMISSTTGINAVLGNIQDLRLRGNRLAVLAGLERLYSLERLDLRDNRIEDAGEIGRFTSLPNIEAIWVEGNPFTKIQPEFRVKLFNEFKANHIDIKLDGSGPGILESWQVSSKDDKPQPVPAAVTAANTSSTKTWPAAQGEEGTSPDATVTAQPKPIARAKTKKSKRVVKLKTDDNDAEPMPKVSEDGQRHMHRLAELEKAVQSEQEARKVQRRARSMHSHRSRSPGNSSTHSTDRKSQQRSMSHHRSMSPPADPKSRVFRRKIEEMRREAGTEWLRVLQELELERKRNES